MKTLIKIAREKKGLMIREVAAKLGVDAALVSKFESGNRKPTRGQIPKLAKNIMDFIPKDYDTLATVRGDLNKDSKEDIAMVLINKNESNFEMNKEPARLLIILFKNKNGYALATSSNKAILCKHCGGVFGDPFDNINIQNNILFIEHYGGSSWRWSYTHKFHFQNNNFYLISQSSTYSNANNYCDQLDENAGLNLEETNFTTGQYLHKKISNEGCKLLINVKKKVAIKPLHKLSTFNINIK